MYFQTACIFKRRKNSCVKVVLPYLAWREGGAARKGGLTAVTVVEAAVVSVVVWLHCFIHVFPALSIPLLVLFVSRFFTSLSCILTWPERTHNTYNDKNPYFYTVVIFIEGKSWHMTLTLNIVHEYVNKT